MTAFDCSSFSHKVQKQRDLNLYRSRRSVENQDARHIIIDGKRYLNFSSNDYLGLNQHPLINKALEEGVDKFGVCSSASSLVTGYHFAHQHLEEQICQWLGKPKCLLFGSGFSANYGVLESLGSTNTAFCLDKLSHASLIDGALASGANIKRFRHNDEGHLNSQLEKLDQDVKLIVSEGVFSMDGDEANYSALANAAKRHNAGLYIDDAHAIGVKGDMGQGSVASEPNIDIIMATFGKAIATSGAFVACNDEIHEYLVNFCRHYIYSTAMSPAIAWATSKSIDIIQKEQWRREKIDYLSQLFSSSLDKSIKLIPSQSSIHAMVLGEESLALNVAERLREEHGIWLTAIRPPTVPINTSRLRVTVTSAHKDEDIKHLVESLQEVLHKCRT
ncbi:aminotransferase class I/II-fold pyridoxal phosphate-dependent enzyme [Thalassotalea fusca]